MNSLLSAILIAAVRSRLIHCTSSIFAFALTGCVPPVDETQISYFDAPPEKMAVAQRAVALCLDTSGPFAWAAREDQFRVDGFQDAMFESEDRDISEVRAVVLIHPESDVVAQLGKDGAKSGCTVGLKGMSPQQAYELALPLVAHFGAVSNTDLGQGLTPNAIQAWRSRGPDYPVFIAAFKTWDILEAPGAAIWLSQ